MIPRFERQPTTQEGLQRIFPDIRTLAYDDKDGHIPPDRALTTEVLRSLERRASSNPGSLARVLIKQAPKISIAKELPSKNLSDIEIVRMTERDLDYLYGEIEEINSTVGRETGIRQPHTPRPVTPTPDVLIQIPQPGMTSKKIDTPSLGEIAKKTPLIDMQGLSKWLRKNAITGEARQVGRVKAVQFFPKNEYIDPVLVITGNSWIDSLSLFGTVTALMGLTLYPHLPENFFHRQIMITGTPSEADLPAIEREYQDFMRIAKSFAGMAADTAVRQSPFPQYRLTIVEAYFISLCETTHFLKHPPRNFKIPAGFLKRS